LEQQAVNDVIYAIGGRTYDYLYPDDNYFTVSEQAVNEQYTPIGYGKPDTSYIPPIERTHLEIRGLSPLNQMYNESSVSLVFTLDKPVNWTGYSLDGKDNVTITGNTTLTGLTSGLHNITVYANGTFGNMGASETINFTVEKPETLPIVTIVAASMASVVACVGVFFYFKKCKNLRT